MIKLRVAVPDDGEALAKIYEYYVTDTTITFEYIPPDGKEFSRRIADKLTRYPYLVAEEDGVPVGYAYASGFRERAAYDWDTELSVYVARDSRHKGVGSRLYTALIEILKLQNFTNLYAWITAPNPESEALHTRLGFEKLCRVSDIGYKHGAWRDIMWYRLCLPSGEAPREIIPFSELDAARVEEIIKKV